MKQLLLITPIGDFAARAWDFYGLVKTAISQPEAVGGCANDVMATKLITRICSPSKTFLDVGSHIGSIVSAVRRSDSSVVVIGFEAIPDQIKRLKNYFPNVEFLECALGDSNEVVNFYVNERASGYSSLTRPSSGEKIKKIQVKLRRLDDLRDFENVDAIKIDVEGAELGVIRGGKETILRNRPIIMFESGPGDSAIKGEMWRLFKSWGYGVYLPNRVAHDCGPMGLDTFLDSHAYPRHTTNYFAIADERRGEFRDRARLIFKIKV